MQEEVRGYQQSGIAGIKLKVGRVDVAQDVERVDAVRQAVGGDFILACDANQAWTPEQAIEFCQAVAPYNVRWIEEPVRWYDQLAGCGQWLRRRRCPWLPGRERSPVSAAGI